MPDVFSTLFNLCKSPYLLACHRRLAQPMAYRLGAMSRRNAACATGAALKLSIEERQTVHDELCSDRFVDQSPASVFASLLDEGVYMCSERTMYRVLSEHQEVRERRNQLRHPQYSKPELLATGPNQVWS